MTTQNASDATKDTKTKQAPQDHPEIAEMKNRMLDVNKRGANLTTEQKYLVLIATVSAQGFGPEAKKFTAAALKAGVSPVAIKEAVLQTMPAVGLKTVEEVLPYVVEAMKEADVKFPMPSSATVNDENRLEKGIEAQVNLFGDHIRDWHKTIPEDEKCIMLDDVSGWCFGDFWTRTGLTTQDRELIVFSALAALGGFQKDLASHIKASLQLGTSKESLVGALHLAVPLLGIPRIRQALEVIHQVQEEKPME